MKGGKGYLLTEVLVCLAAADAFNAAVGAYDETALQQAGFAVEKTEFYCPGLTGPFYYVTVKNSGGKILASVVTGGE